LSLGYLQIGQLEFTPQFIRFGSKFSHNESAGEEGACNDVATGSKPLIGVVLSKATVDSAYKRESGAGDHRLYTQAIQIAFIVRSLDPSDLVVVERLTGDIDGIVMQVFDGPAEPLAVDGLKGKRVADRERFYVHASPLEDEDVPLGLGKEGDEAYKRYQNLVWHDFQK
jgi:hypothetical protein